MTDNEIMAALLPIITTGLAAQSIIVGSAPGNIALKQNYQPRQQGAPTQPAVFLHRLGPDKLYGFPRRSDIYVSPGVTTHTETQIVLATYQVNALAIQDPANTTQLTASDYVTATSLALQYEGGIVALKNAGLGIFRIGQIRQVDFKDEEGRFEANPSFDFVVSHSRTITVEIPSTADIVPTLVAAN